MTAAPDRSNPGGSAPGRFERLVPWALLLAAGVPRFWSLDLRPLHHDEGSNVIFVLRLMHEGVYHYDPTNYHGPLLFYASALVMALVGTTTVAFRIVPAVLGTLMAPLAWSLRSAIGRPAAGAAGLLIAWSPAFVYYSRDNIHEIYFVFLTLGLVVAMVLAARDRSWVWAVMAGAAAGGLLATKETAPLVLVAIGCGWLASGASRGVAFPGTRLAVIAATALVIAVAFYAGGFRTPQDLAGPARALRPWVARALGGEGHSKPWWYFLQLVASVEAPIMILGSGGLILAARRRRAIDITVAVWTGVTIVAYSMIPYKTPWLCLNLVLPLALLAGTMVGAGLESTSRLRRRGAALALALAAAVSLHDAVRLSFQRYDDDREPLVYVQTRRAALQLVGRMERIALSTADGHDIPIAILSPDYLPLNWYLRDFTHVAYHGHLVDEPAAPLVIVRSDAADQVGERLGPEFLRRDYDLRPGVRLALFARRDLCQDDP